MISAGNMLNPTAARPPETLFRSPAMPKKALPPVERRAEVLDTIAAVLPLERRDELAELGALQPASSEIDRCGEEPS